MPGSSPGMTVEGTYLSLDIAAKTGKYFPMTTSDSELAFDEKTGCAVALTPAEQLVLDTVKTGEVAEISKHLDVDDESVWEPKQTIRARFLRHLCLNPDLYHMDVKGIGISRAFISGHLDLSFAHLTKPLRIVESRFEQEVMLLYATVTWIRFSGSFLPGFFADGLTTKGDVVLQKASVKGEARLLGAYIGGVLDCTNARFEHEGQTAFTMERGCIQGRLFWRGFAHPPLGTVNFSHASVGVYIDDGSGWREGGEDFEMDGFVYENLGTDLGADHLIDWLGHMPRETYLREPKYWPQPYEQLITCLRRAGHERDPRKIAIAKQEAYRDYLVRKQQHEKKSTWWSRFKLGLWRVLSGYGYQPLRALGFLLAVWLMGLCIFEWAQVKGEILPAKDRVYTHMCYSRANDTCDATWMDYSPPWPMAGLESVFGEPTRYGLPADYVEFSAFAYVTDVLIPFVDLGQEDNWAPKRGWVQVYMWAHIILGWVFTTIAVAGFTGLIMKD
ncbi:hypothetical protein V5T82_00910 [Magnetovibrio sp. PR-2]|uniref:hypothetical protein n=1 Tax=Magnetovibrio sp. PR-2 TaxID=3120356 RepID=UPI002FCDFC53